MLARDASRVLNATLVRSAASALDDAERSLIQIPLLSDAYPGMTMDDAYAVQGEWVRRKQEAGDDVVGWKIGLTSRAMQAALSIDIPDSGVLLRSMMFANGATIPARRFIQPRVEAEIAFVTKSPLEGAGLIGEKIRDGLYRTRAGDARHPDNAQGPALGSSTRGDRHDSG